MRLLPHIIAASAVILLSTPPGARAQSSIIGRWKGAIEIPSSPLSVTVTFVGSADSPTGTIDIPAQGAIGLPLKSIHVEGTQVSFEIGGVPGTPTFSGNVSGSHMRGTFKQGGATFPFALARDSVAPAGTIVSDSSSSTATKVDSIRSFIARALERWRVPGVAVAVVHDGEIILADGFGLRDVEARLPVTSLTLMPIGSTTKSFTAFIIGTLVDEGRLSWDEPVVTYLPEFALADEAATKSLRVRDLLTHVSGLPRHDLMWYGSRFGRAELFARLRHLELTAQPHVKWQYQNLMYMTAGVLAERVSGKSWETLVQERIFSPLRMSRSTTSIDSMIASGDRAIGYQEKDRKPVARPYRSADAVGPAGSINSNAEDMARWVQLQIDAGVFEDTTLIERATLEEIHAPQVVMPTPVSHAGDRLLFDLYAMGWMQHAFRGRRMLEHGGNIDGFSAVAGFLPTERIGVVVLANLENTVMPNVAMLSIVDILLDERDYDWEAKSLAAMAARDTAVADEEEGDDDAVRVPNTRPSHRLTEYTGAFEHPAYGVITVREVRDRLHAELNGVDVELEHYHYDIFRIGEGSIFEGLLLEFRTATTGEISSLTAPLEPSVTRIEFKRSASPTWSDARVLDRYVGEYVLAGQTVIVRRRDSTLIASIAGQPDYELVPTAEAAFDLKDLPGFSVRFAPKGSTADRAVFVQPNGTFTAKRK